MSLVPETARQNAIWKARFPPHFLSQVRLEFDRAHEAIINPEYWDQAQEQLKVRAAKGRGQNAAKQTSLLCGKLFGETGDRLTPSHSKTS